MPEQNQNKPNHIEKKKSNVKTESTLGKQQVREIQRVLDSEGGIIICCDSRQERIIIEMIPKMISTCSFKTFFLGKQMH